MAHAFDALEKIRSAIDGEARPQFAEIPGHDLEGRRRLGGLAAGEAAPEDVVDDFSERPPRTARFRLELACDVVVERKGRSHILMLPHRHLDVNRGAANAADGSTSRYLSRRWKPGSRSSSACCGRTACAS